jgi:ribosomal protein S12 methylthiotransferase
VLREAETLAKAGVKELLVISQDTSAYGVDVKYAVDTWREREVKTSMLGLCEALADLGIWVRLQYVYPYPSVDHVMPLMAAGKILPYLDIPFQHASPKVLKAMRRPANQEKTADRIAKWREQVPNLTIRSTFIVGFPGETEEDFQFLLDWMDTVQLDRVGCFKYENVTGATARDLADHVSEETKDERYHRFMLKAQEISAARLQKKIGTIQHAIVDAVADGQLVCRTQADAPEVDGNLFVPRVKGVRVGDIIQVEILHADAYDLYGAIK